MARISLSKLERFAEYVGEEPVWIGMDVHKLTYHVAFLAESGVSETFVCSAEPRHIIDLLGILGLKVALLVYEAGPTGFELARELEENGLPVFVVAPSKLLRQSGPRAKTDRLDCLQLAEQAVRGLLKPIAIPSREQEADRSVMRRRHQVVDNLRRVKHRIKSSLLFHGVDAPAGLETWSRKAVGKLDKIKLTGRAKFSLDSLIRELKFIEKELGRIDKELNKVSKFKRHRGAISALRTIPGVGPVSAAAFRLEIFNPKRFNRPEEVAAYLGLAPTVRQSGQSKGKGRIIPTGQKRLRSILVEAAWTFKRYDRKAMDLYNRILARTSVPQKAICAVARRLAILMWRLCLQQRPYELQPVG